jgi:cysteine-rich repeat protein
MMNTHDARDIKLRWRWLVVMLVVGFAAAAPATAQDTCDVEFQLDDPGPFGLVTFSVDYTTALGDFVGDSTLPGSGPSWGTELVACSTLVTNDEFTALDDNAGLLTVFVARLDGTLIGPVPLVSCVFALDSGFPCPAAGDFDIVDAVFPDDPFPPPFPLPPPPAVSVTVSPRTPVCGDGFREGMEACDDGNTSAGDCCSSTCTVDPAGTPCPDASVCTSGETCDGAGSCVVGSTLQCDDGLPCTHDVCDPALGCQVVVEPDPACHPMTKVKVWVADKDNDTADRFKINARMGGPLTAIGDPTATTEYTACVFDAAGGVTSNALQVDVPAGAPWAARGGSGSFGYSDPSRANDGVEKIRVKARLKPGHANASIRFLLIGKRSNLPLPGPVAADAYFTADPWVTVQIEPSEGNYCWRGNLRTTVRNDGRRFLGKH